MPHIHVFDQSPFTFWISYRFSFVLCNFKSSRLAFRIVSLGYGIRSYLFSASCDTSQYAVTSTAQYDTSLSRMRVTWAQLQRSESEVMSLSVWKRHVYGEYIEHRLAVKLRTGAKSCISSMSRIAYYNVIIHTK